MQRVEAEAPGVVLSFLHVLPKFHSSPREGAFSHVLTRLDDRSLDLAAIPRLDDAPLPSRFVARALGGDRLVAVCHPDHPFARAPSLDSYCSARHAFMSLTGDTSGIIDSVLARLGRQRAVAVTVPNAMLALLMAASTGLIAGVPASLAREQAARFGLTVRPLPFDPDLTPLSAVVTRSAHADAGIAWLLEVVTRAMWLGEA
jgi:DNA-binding transcriptional LysR family regulator